jgi:hypothetical protein
LISSAHWSPSGTTPDLSSIGATKAAWCSQSVTAKQATRTGEDGAYERARQRRRERRELARVPEWFSAEDLIAAPWESAAERFV